MSEDAEVINALAAVFDLEGFTSFCGQPDPQLVIPEFLDNFCNWLFSAIRDVFTKKKTKKEIHLWASLPFFAKFMGDGVMFLWNTDRIRLPIIGNVVVNLNKICKLYVEQFQAQVDHSYSRIPHRLRVGIARGQVFSVGKGRDYVGPCINIASRLQKIGSLGFAISRRGFDPQRAFHKITKKASVVVKTSLRGVGEDETIIVLKEEFDALGSEEKKLFSRSELPRRS